MKQSSSHSTSLGRRSLAILITGLVFTTPPLFPCGPYPIDAAFWSSHRTGEAWERFVAGELGIVVHDLEPEELYVAYRHLAGLAETEESYAPLFALRSPAAHSTEPDGQTLWLKTRQKVSGVSPLRRIEIYRREEVDLGDRVSYRRHLNCLEDAFRNAASTLEKRIDRFGASSLGVQFWVEAQDLVFQNCESGAQIPEPLIQGWDPLLRADRAYQIAAAHFYAGNLEIAARLFAEIAADPNSPWQALSAYLVARSQLRSRNFVEAEAQLDVVLQTPAFAPFHAASRRLLGISRARSAPAERSLELAAELLAPHLHEKTLKQNLLDYLLLRQRASAGDSLGAWLDAMSTPGIPRQAWEKVLAHWQSSSSAPNRNALPSLLAALVRAPATAPDHLLAAAETVPPAARFSALYHRARILLARGDHPAARQSLDLLLSEADGKLPVGDLNRIRFLRAQASTTLEEYLHFQFVPAVTIGWNLGEGSIHPISKEEVTAALGPLHLVLADDAVELINHGLELQEMAELALGETLSPRWRSRLLTAVWTRAVVLGDFELAENLAFTVAAEIPELVPEMEAYSAADPVARPFTAALTLLRFPGLAPVLRFDMGRRTPLGEIDSYRDNGWCEGVLTPVPLDRQLVRSPERLAEVAKTFPTTGLDASPNVLGLMVLAHAASRPNDPRVPEALHRVVKATRYGCGFKSYGEISRAAFERLHKEYPTSPWTKETPHWFN